MSKTVLIIGPSENSLNYLFKDFGFEILVISSYEIGKQYQIPKQVSLLCFTGGADISPHLYNERSGALTHHTNPRRDNVEIFLYNAARKRQIPMVGICRGAQFLCVMNDGALVQNVTNHQIPHNIKVFTDFNHVIQPAFIKKIDNLWGSRVSSNYIVNSFNSEFLVASTHHQMMIPHNGVILGISEPLSSCYQGQDLNGNIINHTILVETEIVYWPTTQCLSHQPHPEYLVQDRQYQNYFKQTLKLLLGAD